MRHMQQCHHRIIHIGRICCDVIIVLIRITSVLPLGSKLSLCGVWGGHTPIQSRYASHDYYACPHIPERK